MPYRETPLVNGEYYHVFNRGVAKLPIFHCDRHFIRFERTMNYYQKDCDGLRYSRYLELLKHNQVSVIKEKLKNRKPIVEIISYCLMPNHFHLVVKQVIDKGISDFLRLVQASYGHYYNKVKHRVGTIYQGPFKVVHIESNEYLLHVARYVHINPVTAKLVQKNELLRYKFSSYSQYVNESKFGNVEIFPNVILRQFQSKQQYENFCLDHVDYGVSLEMIKHLTIDGED